MCLTPMVNLLLPSSVCNCHFVLHTHVHTHPHVHTTHEKYTNKTALFIFFKICYNTYFQNHVLNCVTPLSQVSASMMLVLLIIRFKNHEFGFWVATYKQAEGETQPTLHAFIWTTWCKKLINAWMPEVYLPQHLQTTNEVTFTNSSFRFYYLALITR